MASKSKTFTKAEAADEALLLLSRKMRRLHRAEFDDVWTQLPLGAQRAIYEAESRADVIRDRGGKQWEADELDEVTEDE